MPTFHNKDGSLTPYALMCGYLESSDIDGISVKMWAEGDCYHVRVHDHNEHIRLGWATFTYLKDARSAYRKCCSMPAHIYDYL